MEEETLRRVLSKWERRLFVAQERRGGRETCAGHVELNILLRKIGSTPRTKRVRRSDSPGRRRDPEAWTERGETIF